MNCKILLLTYGEPVRNGFRDQFEYSLSILRRLTLRVAPIPRPLLPVIAFKRARRRVREWQAAGFVSPLEPITRRQAVLLADELNGRVQKDVETGRKMHWEVEPIFEFRNPMLTPRLRELKNRPPDAVFILPAYLIDSEFTDVISRADIEALERREGKLPYPVHYVSDLAADPRIAQIMAEFIERELERRRIAKNELKEWGLLLGAHGTLVDPPKPYETGQKANEAVCEAVFGRIGDRFASRSIGWLNHVFGGQWTEPALDQAAETLRRGGIRNAVYFPFGFLADNAETILEGQEILGECGFERLVHLSCLNNDPSLIRLWADRVESAARSI
jgi:ferrochelatase